MDDPLLREPAPYSLGRIDRRDIGPLYDFLYNSFRSKGRYRAGAINGTRRALNTLDEVPDSAWYTSRHVNGDMDREELVAGPGNRNPPNGTGTWRVLSAKSDGVTPGLLIEDERGRRYLVKFDPARCQEMSTGADVVGSKIFYALGYSTPENYIVYFARTQLSVDDKATFRESGGGKRKFGARQLDELLRDQPRDSHGRYRGMASRLIPGKLLGPFRYEGMRTDDPNDLVPHEDRRDLRGLAVFAAWVNHTDSKSINTMDTLVENDGRNYVQHYLIDFGAIFGSDSIAPKDARLGHESFIDPKPSAWQILTLGLYVPQWARARFPQVTSVGHFTAEGFRPERWKPNYPNPAFDRLQPDDAFWATKKVMLFRDDDIRALVATGRYSNPDDAEYLAQTLMQRRDIIGKTWLRQLLPLDGFAVDDGQLTFTDLAAKYGFAGPRTYAASWSLYDNATDQSTLLAHADGFELPSELERLALNQYALATVRYAQPASGERSFATKVYLRREETCWTVVGVERSW